MKGNYLSTLPDGTLISLTLKPKCVSPVRHFHKNILSSFNALQLYYTDTTLHFTFQNYAKFCVLRWIYSDCA